MKRDEDMSIEQSGGYRSPVVEVLGSLQDLTLQAEEPPGDSGILGP